MTRWGALPVEPGAASGAARVVLRPDSLSLTRVGALAGVVADVGFREARQRVRVALDDGPWLDVALDDDTAPAVGSVVSVAVAPGSVLVYPGGGAAGGSGARGGSEGSVEPEG